MATAENKSEMLRQEFLKALPRLREVLLGLSQEQKRSWAQHIVRTMAGLESELKRGFRGGAVEEMMLKEVFNLANEKKLDLRDAFRETIARFAAKRQPRRTPKLAHLPARPVQRAAQHALRL